MLQKVKKNLNALPGGALNHMTKKTAGYLQDYI